MSPGIPPHPNNGGIPPGRYRRILPRQTAAQAADQARALALQDPVPVTTVEFQNADFGNLENFGFVYPPLQTHQAFQPLNESMLSSHHVTAWEGSMQAGWGGFSGRNAAGLGQLSIDTSATQMYAMGNAAAPPHGEMGLVSPTSTSEQEPGPFANLNGGLTDFSANSSYNITGFRPIVQSQPSQQQLQQQQANQHGDNDAQMGQIDTPVSDTSSQTASPSEAALPAGQYRLPTVQPAQPTPGPLRRGPVSAARELPPRPKPGRKPMDQDHANDRRKVQNRQAQRNFRDKRAQRVNELTQEVEDQRRQLEAEQQASANALHAKQERINKLLDDNSSLRNDNKSANDRIASLERELNEERAARQAAERALHSHSVSKQMGFPNSVVQSVGTSVAVPPISNALNTGMHHGHVNQAPDPYAEHEIDITAQWSNGTLNKGPDTTNNHVDWTGPNMDIDKAIGGDCGFCNDSGPCPCREQESRKPKPTLAPGGCDACIADPERAARCKALAERAEVSQRPDQFTTANGDTQLRNDSVAQPTEYVSCSKFFDRTNPRMPSISELFPGAFHAYPSQNSAAGFDVNEREVAHVLQNLRNNGSAGGAPPA